jgi:hypothetical protein
LIQSQKNAKLIHEKKLELVQEIKEKVEKAVYDHEMNLEEKRNENDEITEQTQWNW